MITLNKQIGETVLEAMDGMTIEELTIKCGLSAGTIRNIRKGRRVSFSRLEALCDALNLSTFDLLKLIK